MKAIKASFVICRTWLLLLALAASCCLCAAPAFAGEAELVAGSGDLEAQGLSPQDAGGPMVEDFHAWELKDSQFTVSAKVTSPNGEYCAL